jgi:hypothetical protein
MLTAQRLGPSGDLACPKCGNSSQNGSLEEHKKRCATCKEVFLIPGRYQMETLTKRLLMAIFKKEVTPSPAAMELAIETISPSLKPGATVSDDLLDKIQAAMQRGRQVTIASPDKLCAYTGIVKDIRIFDNYRWAEIKTNSLGWFKVYPDYIVQEVQ